MSNKGTINEQIAIIAQNEIQKQPRPLRVTITEVYEDDEHIDCISDDEETFEYVRAIGSNIDEDNIGVLLFLDDDSMIVIT